MHYHKEGESCDIPINSSIWTLSNANDLNLLKCLILEKKKNVNQLDSAGYTALHYASRNGFYEIVLFLLDNEADVNSHECGCSPLNRSSYAGHLKVSLLLLERGADIDYQDMSYEDKRTSLHKALWEKHYLLASYLISYGADLFLPDKDGLTCDYLIQKLPFPLPPINLDRDRLEYDITFPLNFLKREKKVVMKNKNPPIKLSTAYPAFERVSHDANSASEKVIMNNANTSKPTFRREAALGMECENCNELTYSFFRKHNKNICKACNLNIKTESEEFEAKVIPVLENNDVERIDEERIKSEKISIFSYSTSSSRRFSQNIL